MVEYNCLQGVNLYWIGLTGGIATGKSTASDIIRDLGLPLIDADAISREVVAPGSPILKQIAKTFGKNLVDEADRLDRAALGKIVFNDEKKRLKLESLLHPEIQKIKNSERLRFEKEGAKMAFYDVPLLFEKNLQDEFDATILIYCKKKQQIERLMHRNSIDEKEAKQLLKNQMSIEEKKALADFVVDNTGDKDHLRLEIIKLISELKAAN